MGPESLRLARAGISFFICIGGPVFGSGLQGLPRVLSSPWSVASRLCGRTDSRGCDASSPRSCPSPAGRALRLQSRPHAVSQLLLMLPGASPRPYFCQNHQQRSLQLRQIAGRSPDGDLPLEGQGSCSGKDGDTGSTPDHTHTRALALVTAHGSLKLLWTPQTRPTGVSPFLEPRATWWGGVCGISHTLCVVFKPIPFLPPHFRRCWMNARAGGPATSWSIAVFLDLTFVPEAVNTSWCPLNVSLVSNVRGGPRVRWGFPVSFTALVEILCQPVLVPLRNLETCQ